MEERGEQGRGQEWGPERKGPAGVGGTGPVVEEVRGQRERGGQQSREGKNRTLVGGVLEYWVFYKGEGVD